MRMNGIDIASYQTGINLEAVPCDFIIIKATQGTTYTNPDFNRAYNQARGANKLLGVYHYAGGGGAIAEAEFFLSKVKECVGEAILILDWERGDNPNFDNPGDAKQWLDHVYKITGVKPLIYMSKSVTRQFEWKSVAIAGCGLWVAQYANNASTGYQETPWTDNYGHGAWAAPVIFQYSSNGRLAGWNGNLDINLAYVDRNGWNLLAGKKSTAVPQPTPTPSAPTLTM